jgi:hypothetical protein
LFTRGHESIRITRGGEWKLVVSGPGRKRWDYTFRTDGELTQFQASIEHRLLIQGWQLQGYDRDRRSNFDRRSRARSTPDRRTITRS